MRASLKYDKSIDAWIIAGKNVDLNTPADVAAWRDALRRELERLGGEKAALLLDLDGFEVGFAAKNAYGALEREIHDQYALALLRYGEPIGFSRTVIMLEGEKRGLPADVLPNRTAAVRALGDLRQRVARIAPVSEERVHKMAPAF